MSAIPQAVSLDPKKLFDLSGRVVLITGAGGLLGRALAIATSKAGARTVLVDIDAQSCCTSAEQASREKGRDSMPICADISDPAEVKQVIDRTVAAFGTIDVLINNAQYKSQHFFAKFEEFPLEDWEAVMRVNVTAMYLCCQAAGNQMIASGRGGSIINLGSTYGMVAPDHSLYNGTNMGCPAVYAASKGAVWSLTRYLATYWAGKKIRVNCVQPHGVYNGHEPRFLSNFALHSPMRRMSDASEVVGAMLYLASDASSYVTGTNLAVDGGWTAW
jgi:NAD(P)-dependent dehydrogenase (short-subunit alcohol dehydrogenase family)